MNNGAKRLQALFRRPRRKDIAKRIGVSVSYLSLLEAGKRMPSLTVAARIHRQLGISPEAWTR